jgi:hypothetical protein
MLTQRHINKKKKRKEKLERDLLPPVNRRTQLVRVCVRERERERERERDHAARELTPIYRLNIYRTHIYKET